MLVLDQFAVPAVGEAGTAAVLGLPLLKVQTKCTALRARPQSRTLGLDLEEWQAKYGGGPGLADGRNGKLIEHEH